MIWRARSWSIIVFSASFEGSAAPLSASLTASVGCRRKGENNGPGFGSLRSAAAGAPTVTRSAAAAGAMADALAGAMADVGGAAAGAATVAVGAAMGEAMGFAPATIFPRLSAASAERSRLACSAAAGASPDVPPH